MDERINSLVGIAVKGKKVFVYGGTVPTPFDGELNVVQKHGRLNNP